MADPKIKVPANLIPITQKVADYYGIPFYVLAATIQLGTSWTNNVDEGFVVQVGQHMAQNAANSTKTRSGGSDAGSDSPTNWLDVAANTFGTNSPTQYRTRLATLTQENIPSSADFTDADRWTYDKENPAPTTMYRTPAMGAIPSMKVDVSSGGAGAVTQGDAYNIFHDRTGRYPTEAELAPYVGMTSTSADRAISSLPEAAMWRQDGPAITQARRWADSLSLNLTGRQLTNDEMRNVIQNGWNPDQLDAYLRAQKYGNTDTTLGQATDVRQAVMAAFKKYGLPDPTPEQINFAIVNKIPAANAEAYAEQTKTGTVWGGDPKSYLAARDAIHQIMSQYGIVVDKEKIDANLVNQAVSGKWSAAQMKQAITSGQMPGAPAGTTVDHYATTQAMADSVWKTYFPTTDMPQSYTNRFLTMTPDEITMFVRSLPSPEAKAIGSAIPVGVYNDAKNVASRALSTLGVVGRDPSAQEIAAFATGKLDVEAITKHYATDPEVLKVNPGAQYGLSREAYTGNRASTEKAYEDRFGGVGQPALQRDQARAANPIPGPAEAEPDWLQAVFKEGLNPEQSAGIFDDYFKRLGKAPDASDIYAFKTRSKSVYSDYVQGQRRPEPATTVVGNQPTAPGLGTDQGKRGFA